MSDEYPTDEELERIKTWPFDDTEGWLAYVKSVGKYWPDESFGWSEEAGTDVLDKPVRAFHVSTGGWSGNEDILDAMHSNVMCWMLTWQAHRRGGHYTFHLPPSL